MITAGAEEMRKRTWVPTTLKTSVSCRAFSEPWLVQMREKDPLCRILYATYLPTRLGIIWHPRGISPTYAVGCCYFCSFWSWFRCLLVERGLLRFEDSTCWPIHLHFLCFICIILGSTVNNVSDIFNILIKYDYFYVWEILILMSMENIATFCYFQTEAKIKVESHIQHRSPWVKRINRVYKWQCIFERVSTSNINICRCRMASRNWPTSWNARLLGGFVFRHKSTFSHVWATVFLIISVSTKT